MSKRSFCSKANVYLPLTALIIGIGFAGGVTVTHAASIQIDNFAEVVEQNPDQAQPIDRTQVTQTTGLTTPTTYNNSMTLGGAYSNANVTVSCRCVFPS